MIDYTGMRADVKRIQELREKAYSMLQKLETSSSLPPSNETGATDASLADALKREVATMLSEADALSSQFFSRLEREIAN